MPVEHFMLLLCVFYTYTKLFIIANKKSNRTHLEKKQLNTKRKLMSTFSVLLVKIWKSYIENS